MIETLKTDQGNTSIHFNLPESIDPEYTYLAHRDEDISCLLIVKDRFELEVRAVVLEPKNFNQDIGRSRVFLDLGLKKATIDSLTTFETAYVFNLSFHNPGSLRSTRMIMATIMKSLRRSS